MLGRREGRLAAVVDDAVAIAEPRLALEDARAVFAAIDAPDGAERCRTRNATSPAVRWIVPCVDVASES